MPLRPNPRKFFKFTCNGKYTDKDLDRYSSHVDTSPGFGKDGDCWKWIGALSSGYGGFRLNISIGNNIIIPVTHVSLEMATNKLITEGLLVRHKCDFPVCVRYDHLLEGTQRDNIHDMINRGRQAIGIKITENRNTPSGENHCNSKLTLIQIVKIRTDYNTGEYTIQQLADKFNISRTNIRFIIDNKHWYDPNYKRTKFGNTGDSKLNQEQADEIRRLHSTGKYTQQQLADKFNIGSTAIFNIVHNIRWINNKYVTEEANRISNYD